MREREIEGVSACVREGLNLRGVVYRDDLRNVTLHSYACLPQALSAGSNRLFEVLDLYWRSPESGGLWYKSRQLKETICISFEG